MSAKPVAGMLILARKALALPKHPAHRLSAEGEALHQAKLVAWCDAIRELRLDFAPSSRGWCYVLEEHGLLKGDFDAAQTLINDCRKSGLLPLDLCCEDDRRAADGLEDIDPDDVDDYAARIIDYVRYGHENYTPLSFWDDQKYYIESAVEKVDLKSPFAPVCEPFRIAIRNISGWSDINSRAAMMRRFAHWQAKGKTCVLLYCGDFDPGGLHISEKLRSNLMDLDGAVGWSLRLKISSSTASGSISTRSHMDRKPFNSEGQISAR